MLYGALPHHSPQEAAGAPAGDGMSLVWTQPAAQQRRRVSVLQTLHRRGLRLQGNPPAWAALRRNSGFFSLTNFPILGNYVPVALPSAWSFL